MTHDERRRLQWRRVHPELLDQRGQQGSVRADHQRITGRYELVQAGPCTLGVVGRLAEDVLPLHRDTRGTG